MIEKTWVVAKQGLVGKEICKFLKNKGVSFVSSSHSEADVTDREAIKRFFDQHNPTNIINCSAHVNVDLAEKEQRDLAYNINVTGIVNLAQLAKENGVKLVHIGTDYVFDGNSEFDYKENDSVNPINHYGTTKLEGEQEMLEIYPQAVCVRTASVYGSGKSGLVSGMIRALETQEEVRGVIDQISSPTYSAHLVEAIWDVRDQSGIFHFVNKGYASRLDLVEELKNYAEAKGKIIKCQRIIGLPSSDFGRVAKRPVRSVLSTQKIEAFYKKPIPSWKAALREYLREIGWVVE